MNRESMRKQMEDVREELNRVDEQRAALESILRGYEAWFRANPENATKSARQLSLPSHGRGGPLKGSISFRKGFALVMQEARGEELDEAEIWLRMQAKGVKSDAQNPTGFVNLTARRTPEVEKVASRTWRWKMSSEATNPTDGESH